MAPRTKAANEDPVKDTPPPIANGSALALASDQEALAALDEAGIDFDDEDGLSEFQPKDFRTPALLFNLKGKTTPDGTKVTQDVFYDTIDKTVLQRVNFAILDVHKSNAYQVFDKKEDRNRMVCSSYDQITAELQSRHPTLPQLPIGSERKCKGCPDAQWRIDPEDGKRRAACTEVWSCFCFDLDRRKVFMLRFKKTSLDAIRNYMQAHHYGRRPNPRGGKPGNIPAYTFAVSAHLEMDKSGNFATPVLTRGKIFSSADIVQLKETSVAVRETLADRMREAEASADAEGGGEAGVPDTSFDTAVYDSEANGKRGSQAFVED